MNRKATIKRILRESWCRLAPSPIHGIGVFAVRDIAKGVDPFAVRVRYPRGWVRMTSAELAAAHPGVRDLLASIFLPGDDGAFRIPILGPNLVDIGSYLNHSDRPNIRTDDGYGFVTKRKISAGEELTVNYRSYGADSLLSSRESHQHSVVVKRRSR